MWKPLDTSMEIVYTSPLYAKSAIFAWPCILSPEIQLVINMLVSSKHPKTPLIFFDLFFLSWQIFGNKGIGKNPKKGIYSCRKVCYR
jgi:hypothetical protein